MRHIITAAALATVALGAGMASAQDTVATTSSGTSFRGFRVEGDIGGDRFQSQGVHNTKLGYGATVGFDGQIGSRIVIGPEASYWTANGGTRNCTDGVIGGTVCNRSDEEYGAAVRAGYLVTPALMVFAKGGYVDDRQRKAFFDVPAGETGFHDRYRTDGYQVGGGVEYSLDKLHTPLPLYMNVQYVYSNYDDHTARQRLMAGIGVRFK